LMQKRQFVQGLLRLSQQQVTLSALGQSLGHDPNRHIFEPWLRKGLAIIAVDPNRWPLERLAHEVKLRTKSITPCEIISSTDNLSSQQKRKTVRSVAIDIEVVSIKWQVSKRFGRKELLRLTCEGIWVACNTM